MAPDPELGVALPTNGAIESKSDRSFVFDIARECWPQTIGPETAGGWSWARVITRREGFPAARDDCRAQDRVTRCGLVLEGEVTGEAAGAAPRTGDDAAGQRHAILDTILDIRADWLCSSWRCLAIPLQAPVTDGLP